MGWRFFYLPGRDKVLLRRHRYQLLIPNDARYTESKRSNAAQAARLPDALSPVPRRNSSVTGSWVLVLVISDLRAFISSVLQLSTCFAKHQETVSGSSASGRIYSPTFDVGGEIWAYTVVIAVGPADTVSHR